RDRFGLNNKDIGLGNEKAINQLIAHHSIVMMPDSLKFWVSSDPWQLGTFICYDLKKVFEKKSKPVDGTVAIKEMNKAADSFLYTKSYKDYTFFRYVKNSLMYDYAHHFRFDTD